jgi:uncharacterized membrane-anchored protein
MSDSIIHTSEPAKRLDSIIAWIKGRERFILLATAAFQVLLLLSMIGLHLAPHVYGETILVRVVPVDPRDLFRGDYVILSYDFNRVPPGGIEGLPAPAWKNDREWQGSTVYVTLVPEPDGKHWRADTFSVHRPAGGKYLRGQLTGHGRIEYGIESYYVQEGKGRAYEQAIRNRRLSAEIAVTADGQAGLRGLRIE